MNIGLDLEKIKKGENKNLDAQKTLEKMRKAGNTNARIVMVGVTSKGIKYAIKTGYKKYIK